MLVLLLRCWSSMFAWWNALWGCIRWERDLVADTVCKFVILVCFASDLGG